MAGTVDNLGFQPACTAYVGKLVNKYIYEQLPPGVLDQLRELNPRTPKGYRAHKHSQFLTPDTGNDHLNLQIATVTTLLRISRTRRGFEQLFERAFPPPALQLPLIVDIDDDER